MLNRKKLWLVLSLLFLPLLVFAQDDKKNEKSDTATQQKPLDMEKVSVALGHYFVKNLDIASSQLVVDKIIQGMKEEVSGKQSPMSEEEFQSAIVQIQVKQFQIKSQKNLKEAEEFLAKNAKEKGVVVLSEKLQYKIVKEGQGEDIKAEGTPLINYTGKFLDGKVFSSTEATKAPVALPLKDTVPGVAQGIVGMKKGEKRILYIHPDLAFGINSPFPPNSLVIFEVEVVETVAPPPAAKTEESKPAQEMKEEKAAPQTKEAPQAKEAAPLPAKKPTEAPKSETTKK